MAKEVAVKIKIQLDGQEKVITNIEETRAAIKTLETQLQSAEFGSQNFKTIASNLQKLKSQLQDVDKATEGVGIEKRLRGIRDAVGLLTGSFAVLTGAMTLFAASEEDMKKVQEAEAKAMGALNIVLGVREISEAILEGRIVARQLAEKAASAATKVATAVQAAYNAVLAANPIGLVVAGLAALAATTYVVVKAITSNTDEQEELNKQNEVAVKLNRELSAEILKTAQEQKIQLSVLTDNVAQRNLELKTLEDLKKSYPGFNAFISRNNQLTKEGIEFLRLRIELDEIDAQLKLVRNKRLEAELNGQKAQQEVLDNYNSSWGRFLTIIRGGLNPIGQYNVLANDLVDAAVEQNREITILTAKEKELTNLYDEKLGKIEPLNVKLEEQAEKEKKAAAALNKSTESIDKNLLAINARIAALKRVEQGIKDASNAELKYTSEILEAQKKVLQEQEEYLKSQGERLKTAGEKVLDELRDYFFKVIPSEKDAKNLQDGYAKLFGIINTAIKDGTLDFKKATGWEDFVKFAETQLPGIGESLVNVNEESKKSFVEFFNSLDEKVSAVKTNTSGLFGDIFKQDADLETLNKLLNATEQISKIQASAVENGLTENDVRTQSLKIIKDTFGITQKQLDLQREQANDTLNLNNAINRNDAKQAQALKARIDARNEEAEAQNAVAQAILDSVIKTDDFSKGFQAVNKEAEKNLELINKNKEAIQQSLDPSRYGGITEFFKQNAEQYLSIFTEILNNEEEFFNKFGKGGLQALFKGLEQGLTNIDDLTRKQLEELEKYLKLFGDEFAKDFGLEENPFLKLLDEISKKLKTLPTESEEAFTKAITNIKDITDQVLSAFNEISGRLQGIISTQNSLLLEQLDYEQKAALENVGNTTKRELEIREKLEKDFAKRRFDIEKKARIQELQFALASTIADGASAVVNTLASVPFPANIPLSVIIGGLAGVQAALINEQIQFTQSKQFIARRGGLIQGASHEGGGVPALLEGGEFVMSRAAVDTYGETLSTMNASVGSRPLAIDDSRIVQAIAKQNTATKMPIKTYVLYNDIQNTEKLNNKIEQLSRL